MGSGNVYKFWLKAAFLLLFFDASNLDGHPRNNLKLFQRKKFPYFFKYTVIPDMYIIQPLIGFLLRKRGGAGEQSVTTTFSHLADTVHGRRRGTQMGEELPSPLPPKLQLKGGENPI